MSVQLAIAQLHLSHCVVYKACDALKELGELQYKPGVVSIDLLICSSFGYWTLKSTLIIEKLIYQ